MASVNWRPDSTVASSNSVDNTGSSTDLHSPVTDQSDSTFTHTTHSAVNAYVELGMENLPADAVNNDPINFMDYHVRARDWGPGTGTPDDDVILRIQVLDASDNVLTSQTTVRDHGGSANPQPFTDYVSGTLIQGTPSLAIWNGAKVRFDWSYTKTKGADPLDIDISDVYFAVDYNTQAVVAGNDATHAHSADQVSVGEDISVTLSNISAENITNNSVVAEVDITFN